MTGRHGPRHDLFQLGGGGRQHIESGALALQQLEKWLDQLKPPIGVAAQRADYAGDPVIYKFAQQGCEQMDAARICLDEKPFQLIDGDKQPDWAQRVIMQLLLAYLGCPCKRAPHRCERRIAGCREQLAQGWRSGKVAGPQLGTERRLVKESFSEVAQRISAGTENRGPPCVDLA